MGEGTVVTFDEFIVWLMHYLLDYRNDNDVFGKEEYFEDWFSEFNKYVIASNNKDIDITVEAE